MPSKVIVCEFCNHTTRKDRYGQHVKVRHVKDLAKRFLADTENEDNTILSILRCHKMIKVHSKTDPKAFFLFGVIGRYFEEKDEYDEYTTNENMEHHHLFLSKVLSHITLSDFLKTSLIYGTLAKENRILQHENENLMKMIKALASRDKSLLIDA
jgi:hypothetical protein